MDNIHETCDTPGSSTSPYVNSNLLEKITSNIHSNFIEDGINEDEEEIFPKSFEDPDWRSHRVNKTYSNARFRKNFGFGIKKDSNAPPQTSFERVNPNKWKSAKINARHMKFCPGESCCIWLPLHHFNSNFNMQDSLDTYCIDCNTRKRSEKRKRRVIKCGKVKDDYETFINSKNKFKNAGKLKQREVFKRIEASIFEAQTRFNTKFPLKCEDVSKKLFDSKSFICNITGQILTPDCFLHHHSLTLQVRQNSNRKRVLDVICSDARMDTSK